MLVKLINYDFINLQILISVLKIYECYKQHREFESVSVIYKISRQKSISLVF